jgi:uncharacterized protein YcbK (DUF882 family)
MRSSALALAQFRVVARVVAPLLFSSVVAVTLAPAVARADVQHVVGKDQTLQTIAARYHVSTKAILTANHLANAKQVQAGDVLSIPGDGSGTERGKAEGVKSSDAKGAKDAKPKRGSEPATYAAKAKTPGVVHVKRLATTDEADVRIVDKKGKVQATAIKSFEKLMRSPTGAAHPIEPRLLALLTTVSNHFGSRKIEIVSGFRPYTPTQYTQHSNHNHGKAIDFRVVGVPNEAVRDFCRTLKSTGCGYYPNSVFVHMDVRETSAFWIDYSKPGEPPRYNAANVEADEGASDVNDDHTPAPVSTSTLPGEAKVETPPQPAKGEAMSKSEPAAEPAPAVN